MSEPYYRMHIRPKKNSDQHDLLIALENSGKSVFYIAPEFHLPNELNEYYLKRTVIFNSAVFSPSDIGIMPDKDSHYVVFKRGSKTAYRCSDEPKKIKKTSLCEGGALLKAGELEYENINEDYLKSLFNHMLDLLESNKKKPGECEKKIDLDSINKRFDEQGTFSGISYLARVFYDLEFVIIPNKTAVIN